MTDDELFRVDESRCLILASGGPLLTIEAVEGKNILCSWQADGGVGRQVFSAACLRRLKRIHTINDTIVED